MGNAYLEYERSGTRFGVRLDDGNTWRIDRSDGSIVNLNDDPTVSVRHAIIQYLQDGDFYLTDLNSTNGTMLNGRPITVPMPLRSGDVIKIGTCEFVFHQEGGEMIVATRPPDHKTEATQLLILRQLITVLVADIKGYTGLTLKLGESYISEIIGTLFRQAGHVLTLNHSWSHKFIGDAIMGVWIHESEIPSRHEFELVFRSLVEINGIFANINKHCHLGGPLAFGTSINTGYAAIGNIGSRSTPDHTALGDSVNKAFRLESATRELNVDVVLGRLTYDLLSALTDTRTGVSRQIIQLKGYPRPDEVYATDFATVERILQSLESATGAPSGVIRSDVESSGDQPKSAAPQNDPI